MIRALIVDDERNAREELEAMLQETGAVEIVGSCANAIEAIKTINRERPDVLFLDIQMPMVNGFELLSMIDDDIMPHVVFVSAYDDYALKAFEEKTLDYLLKPVEPARLEKTLEKLSSRLHSGSQPAYDTSELRQIPCVCANRIKLIDASQLIFARSDLSGIHLVTPQGEYFTELTLKTLETRTPLIRCHKQFLINIAQIDEITLLDNGVAEIKTLAGHLVPVSRRYLKNLKETLGL